MIKAITIGLTGQTGAGKSTVGKMLSNVGFYYIDCDEVARLATEKGSPILKKLAKAFGEDIINENGELIRKDLAKRAFCSEEKTRLLNSITHPYISHLVEKKINGAFSDGYDVVVVDAPQLFESNIDKKCSIIVSVIADEDIRLTRIMQRDNIDEKSAKLRINAQLNEEYFKSHSDIIITNNGDVERLKKQITKLLDYIEDKRNEEIS